MSVTPGGIEFEELAGSPRTRYRRSGSGATRVFWVPEWNDASAFATELIGSFTADGVVPVFSLPVPFPGFSNLLVTELDIDPMLDESVRDMPDGVTLDGTVNEYSAGAKVTAAYSLSFDATGGTGQAPERPDGTTLLIEGSLGAEVYATPGRVWKWGTVAGNPAVDPDTFPGIVIPTGEIVVTWGRVPLPPWDAIRSCRGKINSATFLGAPAGTLQFAGARFRRMFGFLNDTELWELTYLFRENIKTRADGSQVGWNYFYREQASGGEHWHSIQNASGTAPYGSADFSSLFKFAVTV